MSSSNRPPISCDASVYRDDKPIGPIRLPAEASSDFVAEFNRCYQPAGLKLQHDETTDASNKNDSVEIEPSPKLPPS